MFTDDDGLHIEIAAVGINKKDIKIETAENQIKVICNLKIKIQVKFMIFGKITIYIFKPTCITNQIMKKAKPSSTKRCS